MNLFEGMVIKTFPDTDVAAYKHWIVDEGFYCSVKKDRIVVGKKISCKYDRIKVGKLIYNARNAKRLNRTELAMKIGTNVGTIYEWEIGRRLPSFENMDRLAAVLQISGKELEKCLV